MARPAHDLTYEQCETWMKELGFVDGDRLDWKRLLKEAEVGSTKYMIKKRWRDGQAPEDRAKIRSVLERTEAKRKQATPSGTTVLGLEEWNRAGLTIAQRPELFASELRRAAAIAANIQRAIEGERIATQANEALTAFSTPTPEPKRPRK